MAERISGSVPQEDVLRAAVWNALSGGIPENIQEKMLRPPESTLEQLGVLSRALQGSAAQAGQGVMSGLDKGVQSFSRGYAPEEQVVQAVAPPVIPQPQTTDVSQLRQDFVNRKAQETSRLDQPRKVVGKPTQPDPEADRKRANFIANLLRIGVPLGAAIAGTANADFLPAASGLSTGFVRGMQRQEDIARETQGTRPFIVFDPETGKQTTINVPKNAMVQQERKQPQNLFGGIDLDIPEVRTGEAVKKARNRIRVIHKESGQTGTIEEGEFDNKLYKRL